MDSKIVPETKLVECPFDKSHRLLPSRLAVHLIRCSRNYPSSKQVSCTLNTTHIHTVAEMTTHIETCPDRSKLHHFMNPVKLPPAESQPANFCVDSAEDWDAEPPAPTYDPQDYCERNFIIRNPQGNPPAARREFRERERRRFNENNPF
ncbi:gametocyte-specific factor 1 homolog [Drosophila kikkawai]|uniref:Gametocyte-specific factor 1 homolog n=1 Tax=Drosophila kikkawai TaxID=30033 RepID=A0A6P4HU77_DROKI|nr:gametocyte-specific factor 1 homolog [Drosophila kikkawai]XP_041631859.1 gametocyte-specific factor 1 homolog [Drosophila kikkawai]